jgi:formate dehydrogenase subunit gamma
MVSDRAGAWLAPFCLALAMALGAPAAAQAPVVEPQLRAPGPDSPAAKEDVQVYRPEEDKLLGRVSIPDGKLAVLVQPEGRDWRAFRTFWLPWVAAAVILGITAVLAAFFLYRGRIRIESGRSPETVPRFNAFERAVHWLTATSFILLALSGLVITFGRWLLIPLIGHPAFTALSQASKYTHNFLAVPFVLGVLVMAVVWIKDNLPERADLEWLRQGGGMLRGGGVHPEAGRFNAGQKGIFWLVVLGGLGMAATGYLLMLPFAYTGIGGMQVAHLVHAILGAIMIAVIIGHIYIGTIGMEGAFDAMGSGRVDANWAREHHRRWYDRLRGREGPAAAAAARTPAE